MPDRMDDNFVFPNLKDGPVRLFSPDSVDQFMNFESCDFGFGGDRPALGICCQLFQCGVKAFQPSDGLLR
jgi:hypothetical protein